MRNTRITERAVWEGALETVQPRIQAVVAKQPGFVSLEYAWNIDEAGRFLQTTTWLSEEDCRRYIREGAAATVATIEESAIPTAPYPNGRWLRENYSAAGA